MTYLLYVIIAQLNMSLVAKSFYYITSENKYAVFVVVFCYTKCWVAERRDLGVVIYWFVIIEYYS